MKIETCHPAYMVLLVSVASGLRRGPHHPHGQTPVDQKHHHYRPKADDTITGEVQILHDAKHIEEDSKVLTAEDLAKMSPEELEFHYFSAHDFDHNSKLDGLELLKAVYHTVEHHEDHENELEKSIEPEAFDFDTFVSLVDKTLHLDDTDSDGFVSYAEYRAARDRSHSHGARLFATAD